MNYATGGFIPAYTTPVRPYCPVDFVGQPRCRVMVEFGLQVLPCVREAGHGGPHHLSVSVFTDECFT
jgi:hypothetical protein